MFTGRIHRVLLQVLSIAVLFASVALADDAPPAKIPLGGFAGTKLGQVRSDNHLNMKFIWCPPGEFTIGSPKNEEGNLGNENQESIKLSNGFWLGQYEVTQPSGCEEWGRLLG